MEGANLGDHFICWVWGMGTRRMLAASGTCEAGPHWQHLAVAAAAHAKAPLWLLRGAGSPLLLRLVGRATSLLHWPPCPDTAGPWLLDSTRTAQAAACPQ